MERKPPGQILRWDFPNNFTLAVFGDGIVSSEEFDRVVDILSAFMKIARWLPLCLSKACKYINLLNDKFNSGLVKEDLTLEPYDEDIVEERVVASSEEISQLVEIYKNHFERELDPGELYYSETFGQSTPYKLSNAPKLRPSEESVTKLVNKTESGKGV
ncbi:hypothetical protein BDN72DRAFT_863627 [Pluteus cervinus]|uniref:Uncharacterized protein n=1 Tax=Pluteus cervinus TaxID=181527 RepID=A0ACD3A6R4_9AGAR|nr:hypothetical protein BDN72DRAFT_863627 [Pluteus cervinus]